MKYLFSGGIGDALLVLATAYKDKDAEILGYCLPGSVELCKAFCEWFKIKKFTIKKHNVFQAGLDWKTGNYIGIHLPDNLNYADWYENENKYISRINTMPDWPHQEKGYVLIQPCGSSFHVERRRFLSFDEFSKLLDVFKDRETYIIGSPDDKERYHNKGNWISFDGDMSKFMSVLNGASLVVGMDSWLKTWGCLLGISSYVFLNRMYDQETPYGFDASDKIFLNKKLWPSMNLINITSLEKLKYVC